MRITRLRRRRGARSTPRRPRAGRKRVLVAVALCVPISAAGMTTLVVIHSGPEHHAGSAPGSGSRTAGSSAPPHDRPAPKIDLTTAIATAQSFLRQWTDPDGRVVRRDQGNDTVSEGQAYGLLLAVAVRDRARFTAIWNWTRTHLQRPDGSLAWQWSQGQVRNFEPAPDADLDAARALQLAAVQWHQPSWSIDADRVATATLNASTIASANGRLLVAGPWATGLNPAVSGGSRTAVTIDPSYLVAGQAASLAATTGHALWNRVAVATAALDRQLITPRSLPPDWVTLSDPMSTTSRPAPIGSPDGSEPIAYGLDAPRLFIRLATSCDPDDRSLAAHSSAAATDVGAPGRRDLDTQPQVSWRHPITDIAAAAIESARGDGAATRADLDSAALELRDAPTYYGAAWLALGELELTTNRLATCAVGVPS